MSDVKVTTKSMTRPEEGMEVRVSYTYVLKPRGMFRRATGRHMSLEEVYRLAQAEVRQEIAAEEGEYSELLIEVEIVPMTPKAFSLPRLGIVLESGDEAK